MKKSPLIIIGMHRSGTTLLTQVLDKAGFFPGSKLDIDHEAYFFLQINKFIFNQASITWDNLYNYQYSDEFFIHHICNFIDRHLSSTRRMVFLGMAKTLKYKDIRDIDFPWCFKDPRTTITLDVWKKVFPGSKVLYIYRNPIDVAMSLKTREEKLRSQFNLSFEKKVKESILYHNYIYAHSLRMRHLEEGIKLWQEYNSFAVKYREQFTNDFYSLCYEDFLENPEEELKGVLEFAGMPLSTDSITEISGMIKKERRFSFVKDESLLEAFDSIKDTPLMTKLGYNSIDVFA